VDPRLPAGYGPFGIAEIMGKLYVTFAKQDATLHDDLAGRGHGFVDVFTNDGKFVRRLVTRGALDSPWGLALAPATFGRFGGDLLVGNFGNGHINAYNPATGIHEGQLSGPTGTPIVIDGLWGLRFGNGNAAQTSGLTFSAGPDHESHGLLGKIVATRGVLMHLEREGILADEYLGRHVCGDWGDLTPNDMEMNRLAVIHGSRIFSSYVVACKRVWIITEADRSATTLLFPSEY